MVKGKIESVAASGYTGTIVSGTFLGLLGKEIFYDMDMGEVKERKGSWEGLGGGDDKRGID